MNPTAMVVAALPTLLEIAKGLCKKAEEAPRGPSPDPNATVREQLEAVLRRVEKLEGIEAEQAKLLEQTIQQMQQLAQAAAAASRVMYLALGLAAGSMVLAVIAIVAR